MIEHIPVARATAPPRPAWTRPPLPRGPSPASKLIKRLRARFAAAAAPKAKECGC